MRWLPMVRRSEHRPDVFGMEAPDRWIDSFFSDWPFDGISPEAPRFRPAVDVFESDGNLVLQAELPGLSKKEIDLKLDGNVLTIQGERRTEKEQKEDSRGYLRRETFHGTFSRSFHLPETVDVEKIDADYKNGVLTVKIPQRPEARPREIPVRVH